MSIVKADYYDGKQSIRHPVSLILSGRDLKIVGAAVNLEVDVRRVRRSLRVANTPRWLYLPEGGACITDDNDTVDRITRRQRYDRWLHAWERRPALAAFAVAIVAAFAWIVVTQAVPRAADEVASRVPAQAQLMLGRQTLGGMDRVVFQPTALSTERRQDLREKFAGMMRAAGDATPYRIEFRASPVLGANAFALPSGIIVLLDDLVKVARSDDEVLGVLAHEVGHVHHRHTLRHLLEGSATALLLAGLTGDIASTTSLAAAAPALLLQTKYSRDNEREADAYGVELMRKSGRDARGLAAMLGRLERLARRDRRPGMPSFLASHPGTRERQAAVLAAVGSSLDELEYEQGRRIKGREADWAQRNVPDPSQQSVLALLDKGDIEALERTLAACQQRYEKDPAKEEEQVYVAFRAFRYAKPQAEATLRRWKDEMPDSYSASLALGIFYLWHGIEARGSGLMVDTPREKIRAMAALLARARPELERSAGLTAKPYLSHLSLVTLSRYVGARELGEHHYRAAAQTSPQSLRLRQARMNALEPSWGGSYEAMEAFARESAAELHDAAAAAKLAARVPAARAAQLRAEGEYREAEALYAEALRLDPSANELRCARAWALTQAGHHPEAYAQATEGFERDRRAAECVRAAVYAASAMGDQEKVVDFTTQAVAANPAWAYPYSQRGWAREHLGQREAAFQDYLAAAERGDSWAEMRAGHGYFMGWGVPADREKGIAWLRKAVAHGNVDARGMLQKALQLTAKQ